MQASTESDEQPLTAERVVREHAPRVYNLARRMLGNESDAEDVTQDVMLQVVRKLDTFRGEAALSTWLHRVTVNAALAHRRKRANHHEQMTEPLDDFSQDGRRNGPVRRWAVPPEQQALDREKRALIEKAIARLPEAYRDVYVLADVQGLANADIAGILNLSVPAVKSRLHRARLLMRDQLAPHFEESMP
jgi:RNA polymerase sigma-70 factor (ECF subfamily)